MTRMIATILNANNRWLSINDIKNIIFSQYGISADYNAIYYALNYSRLAEDIQKDLNSTPQRYKLA